MKENDIRWRQRFQNFSRAFILLRSALEEKQAAGLNQLEQEGVIQRFEYVYELAWKTLKDYLEYSGIELVEATPRKVLKEAAAANIFNAAGISADAFFDMLLARNALSHTYDFEKFKIIIDHIEKTYLSELEKLHLFFLEKRTEDD